MKIAIHSILFVLIITHFFIHSAFAAEVILHTQQGSVDQSSEITISASLSISAANNSTYYLRGVFYKEGSSNYCGLTWNGSNYFSGPYSTNDAWKNFQKIIVIENVWQGEMKVKIDPSDSGCGDSGEYLFKIQRFTESGSGNFDSQNILRFTVILPSPTPQPTPTSKPTSTPRPTPTLKAPLTKATTIVTSAPLQKTITTDESEEEDIPNVNYKNYMSSSAAVLHEASESGEDIKKSITLTPQPTVAVKVLSSASSIKNFLAIIIGTGFFMLCGILAYRTYQRNI